MNIRLIRGLLLFCAVSATPFLVRGETVDLSAAGDRVIEVPQDVSYVGYGFAVDETASTTNYPSVAYPAGVDIVLWRNVKLSDVATFTARLGGGMYHAEHNRKWVDALVYYQETNDNGSVECQFQTKQNSFIYSVRVVFTQKGDDVVGRIGFGNESNVRYTYVNSEKDLGYDFRQTIYGKTSLSDSYLTCPNTHICIKDIGCVLNEGVSIKEAPARIVFSNTDDTGFADDQYETNVFNDVVWPGGKDIVAFKGVALEDVVAISGEMGGAKMNSVWRQAQGYHLKSGKDGYSDGVMNTNANSRKSFQIQYKIGSGLYCCNVHLRQFGADLLVRMPSAEWGYGKTLGEFDFDKAGSALTFTNTVDGADLSLRNLKLVTRKRNPRNVTVQTYPACLGRKWTKIWEDADLEDVRPSSARMGGDGVGGVWRNVLPWLPASSDGKSFHYFQTLWKGSIRTIRVAFTQDGNDVWASVRAVTYGYGKPLPWAAGNSEYQSALTNTVDGKSEVNTLSIRDLTCLRRIRPLHTVTVDDRFAPRGTPLHLRDVELKIAPDAGAVYTLSEPVTGYGTVSAGGKGSLVLASDLADGVKLNVAAGGSLLCDLSGGTVPLLNNGAAMTAEPGAKIRFTSSKNVKNWLETETPYILTSGAELTAADAAHFTAVLDGTPLTAFTAEFSVVDGELLVTFERRSGLVLVIQ